MDLEKLDNDELFIFYALLDSNKKYTSIKNLKRAILTKMTKANNNYLNSVLRGLK